MQKQASELEFITLIEPDGNSRKIPRKDAETLSKINYTYSLVPLSSAFGTYIARRDYTTYVVRLK